MKSLKHNILLAAGAILVAGAGCQSSKSVTVKRRPDAPQNWFLPTNPGRPMRRVAMLPAYHARIPGEVLKDIDAALMSELSKKAVFEVVQISRVEMEQLIGVREVSSVETLPGDLFRRLRDQFGVDGVMFTDLTYYSPYRPVSVGVRSKLVDIEAGRIHWASDVLLDSGNSNVAAAAREFQKSMSRDNFPVESDGGTVLMSPKLFVKFAAFSNYASLQR